MFLSSLIKTQSKSNALSTALSTSSKNHLNPFLKIQVKHVSRSLTSKENREKYDLKKMDDYWETVEQEFSRRMEIAKQVEEKYKTKSESFISASKQSANEVKEIYYVPLTKSDESLLKDFFKAEVLDDIRKGGRLVLLDEVRKYNKAHPFARIEMDFEPLDAQDFQRIKKNFNFLLSEKEFFVVALQQGKKIFEFLDAFKKHKADLLSSLNAAFRRVEHLEAIEASHPLKNNLSVSLRKIDNPQWIKNLLAHNKIDEKVLSEKFNNIYFEYLDCLNSAAAASRGYDIELFEDGAEHKKALEAAKKETKDKLAKISAFLDTIDLEDGKVVEVSTEADKKKSVETVRKAKDAKTEAKDEKLTKTQSEKENESKTENNNITEDTEAESEAENERIYNFDPQKDYSKVFEKKEKDLTFDEYEYIRYCNDEAAEAQYALLNRSYAGRLVLKLIEAEQALSTASRVLEKKSASIVYATENLIKSQEIDAIISELKSLKTVPSTASANKKFNLQKKLDLENEDNLLKLANNPRAFMQNLYWDHVKSAVQDKSLKIPVSVHDKETYVFRVLLKYFADVIQSKNKQFNEKNSRLDYFGENLKSYKIYEKSIEQSKTNLEEADEEKANPENFFTPNFKKLIDFLHKQHGLIEKSVFDYKFNIESEGFNYPLHVMDLSGYLPSADGLGKEVLRFYLENSNEKNLLNDKDEEKVFSYVAKHLAEVQESIQQEDKEKSEGN